MDATIIVALVTALAAIISPILTSVVQSIKDYTIKKLEMVYSEKIKAFNEFASSYGLVDKTDDNKRIFFASAAKATLYVDNKETREQIILLGKYIVDTSSDNPALSNSYLFRECINKIVQEELK